MSHEVDKMGYPIDPELDRLEVKLSDLAAEWRGVARGVDRQDEIVKEYHDTMKQLYALGWDGILDVDSELPTELMPKEYLVRHGFIE